ncbi:MAG TPA: hydrolase, partial [Anaerolineae bacterium]|nr:hydrolase [Anaerolineae bacterium]
FFKIVYDARNLYVAIRARDSKIDEIISRVTRRDEAEQSDLVGVLIDSYFDHRTAFEFSVNAAGVKMDVLHSDDGMNKDPSWDPVWFVATTIDDSGWTAEMRIPFSQLRFGKNNKHTWGLQVYRQLYRKQEMSSWQFIPRNAPGFVHYFGELRGLDDISPPRRIELLPYTVANTNRSKKQQGNPFATGQKNTLSGGLDGKIGLTSDITADFTINPDFGQVEADPSEVNLTAFETFFEEKRPFFVEGKNIFDYRLMIGDGDQAQDMLFYSRRIGRSPHYRPDLGDDEHLDMPQSTSILSAFKVSGKTANGVSIGVLDAVTAKEKAGIERNGHYRDETVEPLTNYFVARLQKDYNEGSTTIGGMLTA